MELQKKAVIWQHDNTCYSNQRCEAGTLSSEVGDKDSRSWFVIQYVSVSKIRKPQKLEKNNPE